MGKRDTYTDENGKFAKGNPGKPKGAIHEKTRIWNEIGEWFRNEALELYKENLIELMRDPKQKAEAMKRYEALLEYFAPKLSRTEVKGDHKVNVKPPIDWE